MILGQFAGGPAVRTDYNQTNPNKADYLVGRENIAPMSHAEDKNNPHGVTIAQIGAAPSGYGLGGSCQNSDEHADNLKKIGWYVVRNGAPDYNWWYVNVVVNYSNVVIVQDAYHYAGTTTPPYAARKCTRTYFDGTWSPWEWVNPKMELGVEYRTTERWNGQVVYTILIDCGLTAALASVQAPTGATRILRWEARSDKHALPIYDYISKASYYAYTYLNPTNHLAIMYEADKKSDGFGNGGYHWYCQMWYTKQ